MDPNATLTEITDIGYWLDHHAETAPDGLIRDTATRLIELNRALATWLANGGHAPEWRELAE